MPIKLMPATTCPKCGHTFKTRQDKPIDTKVTYNIIKGTKTTQVAIRNQHGPPHVGETMEKGDHVYEIVEVKPLKGGKEYTATVKAA